MYAVTASRSFVAQHSLTVPDAGPEGEWHSHRYGLEAELRGTSLNERGYLVDIDDLRAALDLLVDRYRDETLNDLPEFEGLNPSLEHFARICCDRLLADLDAPTVESARVALREDDVARAAYERDA
ncbi:6-pyruvoyl trahydropterin synthase family protein [Natrinema sp. 74]|uniref:6-pyruvoyl trahydropterin synthase family protein n=1 Tax=Natrinema sp. 74 TaxID=3384159 RepID=UPI0038D499C2